MRLSYEFSKLCGRSYSGGNLVFTPDGNTLVAAVGNRVVLHDLVKNTCAALPSENLKDIRCLDISPDGSTIITIDIDGRGVLTNFRKKTTIAFFNCKDIVRCIKFSPDSRYVAIACGKKLCIYKTPELVRAFSNFQLQTTRTANFDDITCIDWSIDGQFIAVGGKDCTVRIFSLLDSLPGFHKMTLSGHKEPLVGLFFLNATTLFSVSRDRYCFEWSLELDPCSSTYTTSMKRKDMIESQHDKQHISKVASVSFKRITDTTSLIAVGYNTGIFAIAEIPNFTQLHSLSISQNSIEAAAFNSSGAWIAFGSSKLGQLLVWEWKSETYVMKQQGHFFDMQCIAYSPDGQLIATGGDDGKVKLWNASTGYCFVTFEEHTGPITDLIFTSRGKVVISSSRDGSVRAFDLMRYKNFRIMTAPSNSLVQFTCVTSDPSGDIICAGSLDPFEIYVWSLRTGRLLDVLSGHEGPISSLAYSAEKAVLVSSSWDKTVKIWNLYSSKAATETLEHGADVLDVAISPDGDQICSCSLNGQLNFWHIETGELQGTIDGRKDILGGRKEKDARAAKNSSESNYFTTVSYSPDGNLVLAGGNSKFICMYEVSHQLLLKKIQISRNLSLDGIRNYLDSRQLTDAGAQWEIDHDDAEDEKELQERIDENKRLPGVRIGDYSSRKQTRSIQSNCVRFSPSGIHWAVVTVEGLMIYGLDAETFFDPTDLGVDVTPENISKVFMQREFSKALLMSLRLNEKLHIDAVVSHIPPGEILLVVESIPNMYLERFLTALASLLTSSLNLEYYMRWVKIFLLHHGQYLRSHRQQFLTPLRNLQKSIIEKFQAISEVNSSNQYILRYIESYARRTNLSDEDFTPKRVKSIL